jgi:hypothetical protein
MVQKAALVETHNGQQQQQQQSLTSSLQTANQNPSINPSIKNPHPSSASLLYPVVNKEVEQQFSERGMIL